MEERTGMPSEDVLFDLSELFKIFGDSTRIRILFCLAGGERSVNAVAAALNLTQSAVSHQLSLLKKSKLIAGRREGKTIYYSLADDHVRTILDQGMEHVTEPAGKGEKR